MKHALNALVFIAGFMLMAIVSPMQFTYPALTFAGYTCILTGGLVALEAIKRM